jgi:hypothetical protein
MSEPIRKITLKNGTVRYRLVVDAGRDEQGHRQQLTRTFDRLKDARGELARIRHETDQGTYVRPSEETVNAYLDGFLKGATRGRRASTRRNYDDAFRPVRERLGTRKLQSITKADVEVLMDWMLTSGRKRGGKPGRSVRPDGQADPEPAHGGAGDGSTRGQARPQRGEVGHATRAHSA